MSKNIKQMSFEVIYKGDPDNKGKFANYWYVKNTWEGKKYYEIRATNFWIEFKDLITKETLEIEKNYIADIWVRFWWSFLSNIWKALYSADTQNVFRVLDSFMIYILEYLSDIIENKKNNK